MTTRLLVLPHARQNRNASRRDSRRVLVFAVVLAGCTLASARGAGAQYSAAYDTCVHAAGNDTTNLTVCAQTELNRQDARLNQMYRKRITQLAGSPSATTSLRADERKWIRARDSKCKSDSVCLLKETHDRADMLAAQVTAAPTDAAAGAVAATGAMPAELLGSWTVVKTLPTKTISCWGESDAQALIGTQIVYGADSFQWKDSVAKNPRVTKTVVTAKDFELNNSGGGANDSSVSFKQLGIKEQRATQFSIDHADANITGGTTEVPGDVVLLRDPTHLIFSVCNLYFLAEKR
jgi:uncharacterized protein YecT (DUF1311 family)